MDTEVAVRFGSVELKESAEPVSLSGLLEGSFYFALSYVDDDLLIPVMNTRVFAGRDLELGDVGKLYFQDQHSYREGIRYDPGDKDTSATFYVELENELNHIFEFEYALEELMRCSLRRRKM